MQQQLADCVVSEKGKAAVTKYRQQEGHGYKAERCK
jgi:hypothetical protein